MIRIGQFCRAGGFMPMTSLHNGQPHPRPKAEQLFALIGSWALGCRVQAVLGEPLSSPIR